MVVVGLLNSEWFRMEGQIVEWCKVSVKCKHNWSKNLFSGKYWRTPALWRTTVKKLLSPEEILCWRKPLLPMMLCPVVGSSFSCETFQNRSANHAPDPREYCMWIRLLGMHIREAQYNTKAKIGWTLCSNCWWFARGWTLLLKNFSSCLMALQTHVKYTDALL